MKNIVALALLCTTSLNLQPASFGRLLSLGRFWQGSSLHSLVGNYFRCEGTAARNLRAHRLFLTGLTALPTFTLADCLYSWSRKAEPQVKIKPLNLKS